MIDFANHRKPRYYNSPRRLDVKIRIPADAFVAVESITPEMIDDVMRKTLERIERDFVASLGVPVDLYDRPSTTYSRPRACDKLAIRALVRFGI